MYTTFVDKASNSHYCEQNLIVKDLIKPVIICPRDYDTLTCDDKLPYIAKNLDEFKTYLYGDVLDAHNMIPDKFTHKDEFVGDKCESTLTRTYTIYDIFGGSSSCVNKIHVKDNIPPVWTERLSADTMFLTCDEQNPEFVIPKAADACNDYTAVLSTTTTNRVYDITKCGYYNYDKTYKYFAVDGCGNVNHDSITFVVSVRDTNKPKFDVPDWFIDGEVTAKSDGKCAMLVPDLQQFALNWDDPCATLPALSFSQSPAAGTPMPHL